MRPEVDWLGSFRLDAARMRSAPYDVRGILARRSSIFETRRISGGAALREREDLFRAMADIVPQLVWTTRADGVPDWFNRRWFEYTGMSSIDDIPAEDTRYDWATFLHPDDRERTMERWAECLRTGDPYEAEFRLREAATGEYRWFLARGQAVRDDTGAITRWFGTCTDIDAQRRESDRSRRLERAAARMLAASTGDDVIRVAIEESIDALNASGAAINLYDAATNTLRIAGASDDATGREARKWGPIPLDAELTVTRALRLRQPQFITNDQDFDRTSPEAAAKLRELGVGSAAFLPLVVGERLIGSIGFTFAQPGTFRPDAVRFMEELAALCAQALDRAQLFQEARDARADAERANSAKSSFLAVMSHELRSPLNAIDGHASLIEDGLHGPVSSAQVEAIRRIRNSARILMTLINDLLDFGRIEAGKLAFDIREVPLGSVLASLRDVAGALAASRSIEFAIEPISPDVTVRADPDRMQQILLNLVTNAIKFTDAGGRVEISAARVDQAVRIHVRDTGIGIPAGKLDAIFDPFVQVDQSHGQRRQGVGLGLAISRDLARGMQGDLTVVSTLGKGSIFTLTLPALTP